MRLLTHLTHLTLPVRAVRPAPRPAPLQRDEPPVADDVAPGCGWFDSSHDLQHGLRVTEHAQADAVVNQIPLSWWLGWELDAALMTVRR